ncbi:MAG TPA: hypothetical protein PKO06_03960 [Candidatus Ozemobacteraceae bacterium]|nr:hypothetical protein [Candidatus Ozemobacteraceae bacterium]
MKQSSIRSLVLPLFFTTGLLVSGSVCVYGLSDSTLSLVQQLKSKVNTSESPAPTGSKPALELNAPPPIVSPVPSQPEPAIKPQTQPTAEPAPALSEETERPAKKKRDRRKKETPTSVAKPAETERKPAVEEPKQPEPVFGPGPNQARTQRDRAEPAPTIPRQESPRTSEASEMVKHIMEKLATVKQGRQPAGAKDKGKPAAAPKEESAINITSDYSAPVTEAKPTPAPAAAPALTPAPAPAPAAPQPPTVKAPASHGIERSFGELSDDELIQYAKEYVWSSEKSRKHNPPPTPPYRPKKKNTDAKADKSKTQTKTSSDKVAATKAVDKTATVKESKSAKPATKAGSKTTGSSSSTKKTSSKKKAR